MAINITGENFEKDVLGSDMPVLLDFWAEWCGYCVRLEPALQEIEAEYAGKVTVAKLNVDEARELATEYSIMSIPALILFRGGEAVSEPFNPSSKSDIRNFLADHGVQ